LVTHGKLRAFGCSTFPAHLIVEAQHAARWRGTGRFWTEQPPYSILVRGVEREVLPVCQRYGMGVLTWSPLAFGFLSGNLGRPEAAADRSRPRLSPERFDSSRPENAAKFAAASKLADLAAELGCTLPELAVAFPVAHPAVTSVIVGPRTMGQLQGLLRGAELVLDDATLDRVDEIVAPGSDLATEGLWRSPALADPQLRRRPLAERSASAGDPSPTPG
jgi:aryl-alcohol dehydrogenase-like predicted oxidoreductase